MKRLSIEDVKAATAGMEIVSDGEPVDLPYVLWTVASGPWEPRTPVSDLVRAMPNWLLHMVENDQTAAMWISIFIEGLWSKPVGRVNATTKTLAENLEHMQAICSFEALRRIGLHRWEVQGDDRLGTNASLRFEINPACLDLYRRADPRKLAPDAVREIMVLAAERASLTDWVDVEAITGP